ncbi:MAG: hypothetical protein LBV52_05525 [Spirochaetaceae bacterium]|jgi:hypothetical protein|nr:hypothetical protein [Spirochaetaceae bacterium]
MKKTAVFLLFTLLFCAAASGQNLIILQYENNSISPAWKPSDAPSWYEVYQGPTWNTGSIGANILVLSNLIQNDTLLSFGTMNVFDANKISATEFLFNVQDNFFVSLNTKVIGLRAGLSGGIGAYSGHLLNFYFNIGGLAGIHILPEAMFSFVLDIRPCYTIAFNIDSEIADFFSAFKGRQYGWTFPISASLRINLDKF